MPKLEAAARRLERLLGGGLSDKDRQFHTYTNPTKVVRRWLGTASGAAGDASPEDIAAAATTLLDPEGRCANGRQMLMISDNDSTTMDVEDSSSSKPLGFLTMASSREVESWLISLAVRLLYKDNKFTEAFDLVQKGITLLLEHLNVASTNLTSLSGVSTSSLFPLLARMYRYRSLVAEAINDQETTASLRQDMVKAHNLASLRRDVDCQATLLNLLLRDLLLHSQSKLVVFIICQVGIAHTSQSNFCPLHPPP
jgi:26S proteasome regulatory subunit N3